MRRTLAAALAFVLGCAAARPPDETAPAPPSIGYAASASATGGSPPTPANALGGQSQGLSAPASADAGVASAAPASAIPGGGSSATGGSLAGPAPRQLLARATGRVLYEPERTPAANMPFVIETECETLAGVTDSDGGFSFRALRLPATLRSTDGLRLAAPGAETASRDGVPLSPTGAANGQLREVMVWSRSGVGEVTIPRAPGGERTEEIERWLTSLTVLAKGRAPRTVVAALAIRDIPGLRRAGFQVSLIDADSNNYAVAAEQLNQTEWSAFTDRRIAEAREGLRVARLGHARRPFGRVRSDAACLARLAAAGAPAQAP